MEINSYLLEEQLDFALTAGGNIATAANSVDIAHHFGVSTNADLTLTLPNPTINRDGWSAIVTNTGNFIISMYGVDIMPDNYARYIWDNNVWHSPAMPVVAPPCPDPMTRAALRALRTSGGLIKDCHYVITDYNRGTVGAAEIELHAVDANTLSMDAHVKTTFDTLAWDGRYDIDTNRLTDLNDNIGNEVSGEDAVDFFPWGLTAVSDNLVFESRVNYTAGTMRRNRISGNSILNLVAGTFNENDITGDCDVTITSGSNYENTFKGSSVYNQVGTGFIRGSVVDNNSSFVNGNVNVNDSVFERAALNTTGSTGVINYSRFTRFTGNAMQNVPSLTITSCDFTANSQIAVTGATRTYLTYLSMSGYGRILQSAGTQLDSNYSGLRDYSYIQVTAGRLYANYSSVSNVSYIQHASTGTNRVDRSEVTTQSRIRFLNTVNNCRVYYCEITSGSYIEHRGTSSGSYFYYCSVDSSSTMYSNNSVNLRAYYNSASANSQIYSSNVTATHYIYYCACNGHGYIWFDNSSGGRIYAVSCHGQGLLRFRGATAAGRIYYSSFTAYYYLYANNWTITRTSLHGYGRRTYNVTNPATNGTFTQNF